MASALHMIGNAALFDLPDKVAFLSSRRISAAAVLKCYDWAAEMRDAGRCVIGGFQSSLERDVLKLLLRGQSPIAMVLARGLWRTVPSEYREAINAGRLLVASPFPQRVIRVSTVTAAVRNEYVLDNCKSAVFASLDPCGSLARLVAARPALNYRVLDGRHSRHVDGGDRQSIDNQMKERQRNEACRSTRGA